MVTKKSLLSYNIHLSVPALLSEDGHQVYKTESTRPITPPQQSANQEPYLAKCMLQ